MSYTKQQNFNVNFNAYLSQVNNIETTMTNININNTTKQVIIKIKSKTKINHINNVKIQITFKETIINNETIITTHKDTNKQYKTVEHATNQVIKLTNVQQLNPKLCQ